MLVEALGPIMHSFAEVIVVDNGSCDESAAVARRLGAITLSASDARFDQARNMYLETATQPWIMAIDADERIHPASLSALGTTIESIPPDVSVVSLPRLEYLGTGRWSEVFTRRLSRRHAQIRYTAAGIHDTLGASASAVGRIDHIVDVPIHHLDVLVSGYGRSAAKRERNVSALTAAIANDEPDWQMGRLHLFLGVEYLALDRYEAAEQQFRRAITIASQLDDAYWSRYIDESGKIYLAQLYLRLNRLDLARELAEQVPYVMRSPTAHGPTIRAEVAVRQGDPEAATRLCNRLVRVSPKSPHAHINLAALLRTNVEDSVAAFSHLMTAWSLNPMLGDPAIYEEGDVPSIFAAQDDFLSICSPYPMLVKEVFEHVTHVPEYVCWYAGREALLDACVERVTDVMKERGPRWS